MTMPVWSIVDLFEGLVGDDTVLATLSSVMTLVLKFMVCPSIVAWFKPGTSISLSVVPAHTVSVSPKTRSCAAQLQ